MRIFWGIIMLAATYTTYPIPPEGKRVAVIGDSMSWIGGDSCQNAYGWTYHFKKNAYPAAMDIYARSGATWTVTKKTSANTTAYSEVIDDDNVLFNQALRLKEAVGRNPAMRPDIIIAFAGANDAWFIDKRPDMLKGKKSQTSLEASVRRTIHTLKQDFPGAYIFVVTPTEITRAPNERLNKIADIICEAGMAEGAVVFRADKEVDIRSEREAINFIHTYDGVHTNECGAQLIADFIEQKLRSHELDN